MTPTQTKPVGELVAEIRRERDGHVPLTVKRGRAMPHFKVQQNAMYMAQEIARHADLQILWVWDIGSMSMSCHDHDLNA